MTQNSCCLQLVRKFKKLKKKLEFIFPVSLLFSHNCCIISWVFLWTETLILDLYPREFLSPSTSHAANLFQKASGFKNIKPQIWTYTHSEVWGVIERGRERFVLLSGRRYIVAPCIAILGEPGRSVFHPLCPSSTVYWHCIKNSVLSKVRHKTAIDFWKSRIHTMSLCIFSSA